MQWSIITCYRSGAHIVANDDEDEGMGSRRLTNMT